MEVNIEKLAEFIEYVYEGSSTYQFQAYIDDKTSKPIINSVNYQKLLDVKLNYWHREGFGSSLWSTLDDSNLREGLQAYVKRCELEKRALCFYMNGSVNRNEINKIRFHFVDIDGSGGSKEEQYERIMNAPLKPTYIYEGRAGYKVLYQVADAHWDNTSEQSLADSTYIFEKIQFQLIGYFKADRARRKPNDCFRLPYVNNYKEWGSDGKVYQERVVYENYENVYTQQELADAFPSGEEPNKYKKTKMYDVSSKEVKEVINAFTDSLDIAGLDYYNYGNKISYQCPVHGDSKPSAYIYFDGLICRCSNGENGECEVENGKSLSWLAKHQGWDDLYELASKLEAKPAEKYEKITLEQLQENSLTPLLPKETKWEPVVKAVVAEVVATMQRRKITVDESSRLIYLNLVTEMRAGTNKLSVWPLEPGGGKSTTLVTYLKYMLQHHIDQAGTLVVVERNETAIALAKELGRYSVDIKAKDGTAIDVGYREMLNAAYVMQSAYTYKECKKTLTAYEHNVCGRCSFKKSCVLPKKHDLQKTFPIVIMTHARFQMEGEQLKSYSKWRAKDGNVYERRRIIIDEKPPITDVIQVSTMDIEEFIYDLKSLELEIGNEIMLDAIGIVNKLKSIMLTSERDTALTALDSSFKFTFESEWYKYYEGSNVTLLKNIETIINNPCVISEYRKKITISTARRVRYNLANYNTIILDGTAKYDQEYQNLGKHQMMDIPTIKNYDQLTFHFDSTVNSSKNKLMENKEVVPQIAKFAKEKSCEKPVLLLCFKSFRNFFEIALAEEIKAKRIAVNHFGNVKGSNSFSQFSCLIYVGIIYKGDPYYVSKSGAIFSVEPVLEVSTIKQTRRFHDIDIEKYKLSDQMVGGIQDILRTSIRNNGSNKDSEVYIFSRDTVLLKLWHSYFKGSQIEPWNLLDTKPKWYEPLNQAFESLKKGEKISKADLREILELEGAAGKKQLQRITKADQFTNLLAHQNMVRVNSRAFIKQESTDRYVKIGNVYRGLKAISKLLN